MCATLPELEGDGSGLRTWLTRAVDWSASDWDCLDFRRCTARVAFRAFQNKQRKIREWFVKCLTSVRFYWQEVFVPAWSSESVALQGVWGTFCCSNCWVVLQTGGFALQVFLFGLWNDAYSRLATYQASPPLLICNNDNHVIIWSILMIKDLQISLLKLTKTSWRPSPCLSTSFKA